MVRSSQYLNNLVEQDHRRVKQRIRPMLGFKRFDNAVVTIFGIELAEKIKKGHFNTGTLGGRDATMAEMWNASTRSGDYSFASKERPSNTTSRVSSSPATRTTMFLFAGDSIFEPFARRKLKRRCRSFHAIFTRMNSRLR
jgi:hypothetical protein